MGYSQSAVQSFREGFSCSQAVVAAFSGSFGLERTIALKISQALGGGLARMGLTCGAVTGALLVIGLKHGRTRPDDDAAKEKTYALAHKLVTQFKARHGTIVCRELIGADLSTPKGHDEAHARGVFETICPNLVGSAAEILEQIL
jgi:C_GCAxxG_C_C family probable redox protein